MVIKFWCWLWGHKVMVKACTGNMLTITDRFTMQPMDVPLQKWERVKNCIRCGAATP